VFEDILGPTEEFFEDTIEFEWHGDSVAEEKKGPKSLDLSDFIDEKELEDAIDKIIEEALKNIADEIDDEEEDTGQDPFGI